MKYKQKTNVILLILIIQFSGCIKYDNEFVNPDNSSSRYDQVEGSLLFGRELEDPYAINNIIKAYSNLKMSGDNIPEVDIKPNHTYVRFLPKNDEEWQILKKDSSLVFYDYPLNFETIRSGTFYQDSPESDSSLVWQYCVIPRNKIPPSIFYEVIYEVFIPPDDVENKNLSDEMIHFYDALEFESVRLTGNLTEDDKPVDETKGLFSSKWTPKGTIKVWDDLLGRFIPLSHVNVHARWFTNIKTDLTDGNGYFQTGNFRHSVNYSIKWERSHYTIRNGMFLQAWYNGPKKKGDWNLNIRGGKSLMYATIHRAAWKLFYGDNLSINRPNLSNGRKTKICYRDSNGKGVFWGDWSASGILPDIQIWGKVNGNYKPTNKIFGSTVHELGHQAHSQYVGNIRYWKTSKIIQESWADAVEWSISNNEYHSLGLEYGVTAAIGYNHRYNTHSRWPNVGDKDYSPIFIDLMDNINQRVFFGPSFPNDMISDYSLSFIHYNILGNSYGINSLREEVMRYKDEGGTDNFQIEQLFDLY